MSDEGLVIINFAHPLTSTQRAQVGALTGHAVADVIDVPTQVDLAAPLAPQVAALVDRVGLSATAWQSLPLIINPPGLAPLAAMLVAELHGRLGHFPTLLRLRPVVGATPTQYEVAELMDLQGVRDAARERRMR